MAGIYIHIPFCKQRCTYCDFHFSTNLSYRERMIACIVEEIHLASKSWEEDTIETIYLGGGTPSLLTPEEMQKVLSAVQSSYNINNNPEVTIEANPDDIDSKSVNNWVKFGVNRLSIGLQAFSQNQLEWMNRAHNAEQALNCVQIANEGGITNLSLDLIYGLPNLSTKEWKKTLDVLSDLQYTHLSSYILTVEEKTALKHQVTTGQVKPVTDEVLEEQYAALCEYAVQNDLEHYEISNFAKPGFRSKHNSSYWNRVAYLGIGPSAHGFKGNTRFWNVANNHRYMTAVENGDIPREEEVLTKSDILNEQIMGGLRK
ncbi:MAG: radical SAM family heme chaperone HemW, partial [Flavobacteriales bacterium]|nr:radical SAM family heme chaperone HemW [Flavobacteriales bacterium]